MLGVSGMLGNSGDAAELHEKGGGGDASNNGGGGEAGGLVGPTSGGLLSEEQKLRIEEGDRNSGGNRWPRQETLALLKIRSEMDVEFRDSSLKGPLWEEVSRKLAELGFHRSAKKCKEKFENVYKYHRRTKDGRASKPDGKTYRFFDQLQALETHQPSLPLHDLHPAPPPRPPQTHHQVTPAPAPPPPVAVAMPGTNPPIVSPPPVTVPSTANPTSVSQNTVTSTTPSLIPSSNILPSSLPPPPPPPQPSPITNLSYNTAANLASISTSSSTSSDEEPERRCKRKRKWADFFQRLMNEVIEKQEEMQKKFLETLEKRERDRLAREEAWRVQEMARLNREHDLLVQERSMAASKDAAVIAYLQKISGQQVPNVAAQLQIQIIPQQDNPTPPPPAPPQPQPVQQPQLLPLPPPQPPPAKSLDNLKSNNGGENFAPASSSRWPKAEVEALINLRTKMDLKYQDNGPKGPLWEEMSAAMRKIGYNRSAKRCKEKWENINKYFKKVKESNKKRPEDSKTCPYFHQLDALYREKEATATKPENPTMMVPIMVQPEQQWPLPPERHHRPPDQTAMEDHESENLGENHDDDDGDDGDDDDDEDEAGGYEIVANKPSSVGKVE